jgi:hypothetical protein
MRTEQEEAAALLKIKQTIAPDVEVLLEQFVQLLSDLPGDRIDPACFGGIGNLIVKLLEERAPQIPEASRWGYAYAVADLLRERLLERSTVQSLSRGDGDDDADEQQHGDGLPADENAKH